MSLLRNDIQQFSHLLVRFSQFLLHLRDSSCESVPQPSSSRPSSTAIWPLFHPTYRATAEIARFNSTLRFDGFDLGVRLQQTPLVA